MVLHSASALPVTGRRRFSQCIKCLHSMRERSLNFKRLSAKVFFFFLDTTFLCQFSQKIFFFITKMGKNILFSHSGPYQYCQTSFLGLFQPVKVWPASFTSSLSQLVQIIPVHHSCGITPSSSEIQRECFIHFTGLYWCSDTAELLKKKGKVLKLGQLYCWHNKSVCLKPGFILLCSFGKC